MLPVQREKDRGMTEANFVVNEISSVPQGEPHKLGICTWSRTIIAAHTLLECRQFEWQLWITKKKPKKPKLKRMQDRLGCLTLVNFIAATFNIYL